MKNGKVKHQHIRKHFRAIDPAIHRAMETVDFDDWLEPRKKKRGVDYFSALCREITGQQLSSKAASTIYGRFLKLFPNEKLDPQILLTIPDQTLRDAGISWAKARYVKNIADAFLNQTVQFNQLNQLEDEAIVTQLTTIKGVGRWTSEMFLIFTLGREDVFSFGDLGLKRGLEKTYKLNNPTVKQIEKIITPWSPYKTYGSIALWHSLDNK